MTRALSLLFSCVAGLFYLAFAGVFLVQSMPVWEGEGWQYLAGVKWFYRQHIFGALPMIYGTVVVSLIAIVLAGPLGIGCAVFLAEYLPERWRLGCKVAVELLAGIPSVVYGLIGILLLREWVYRAFERFQIPQGDTLLTAGVLLAVMILPTVVTLTDDALRSVPGSQRRAARSLGLTRSEVILGIALPQSIRGIGSALLLALGRALGETIAVYLVVGRRDNYLPKAWYSFGSTLEPGQTLTSKLGGAELNIAYGDKLHWGAMCGLGLLLLILVAAITLPAVFRKAAGDAQV